MQSICKSFNKNDFSAIMHGLLNYAGKAGNYAQNRACVDYNHIILEYTIKCIRVGSAKKLHKLHQLSWCQNSTITAQTRRPEILLHSNRKTFSIHRSTRKLHRDWGYGEPTHSAEFEGNAKMKAHFCCTTLRTTRMLVTSRRPVLSVTLVYGMQMTEGFTKHFPLPDGPITLVLFEPKRRYTIPREW